MFAWLRTRRWRRSAEDAISSPHFEAERVRLAAELLPRTLARMGAGGVGDAAEEAGDRVAVAVERQVDRRLLEASLGLRYVRLMRDRLRSADYEDVPRLRAETEWVERYLAVRLRSKWVRMAQEGSSVRMLPSLEDFYAAVADGIVAELTLAALAA